MSDVTVVLEFLTMLYKKNLGYSALNTARSALSSFLVFANTDSEKIGNHELVKRFMRGVFLERPTLPRLLVT